MSSLKSLSELEDSVNSISDVCQPRGRRSNGGRTGQRKNANEVD